MAMQSERMSGRPTAMLLVTVSLALQTARQWSVEGSEVEVQTVFVLTWLSADFEHSERPGGKEYVLPC